MRRDREAELGDAEKILAGPKKPGESKKYDQRESELDKAEYQQREMNSDSKHRKDKKKEANRGLEENAPPPRDPHHPVSRDLKNAKRELGKAHAADWGYVRDYEDSHPFGLTPKNPHIDEAIAELKARIAELEAQNEENKRFAASASDISNPVTDDKFTID